MLARAILLAASLMWPASVLAQTAAPLVLEAKIALGEVSGRIDHLSIDPKRQRLFVAELGNNSLGVVDLAARKVLRRISGLSEPQGVAYVPFADSVYVANAGDGSVRVLRGDDLAATSRSVGTECVGLTRRTCPTPGSAGSYRKKRRRRSFAVIFLLRAAQSIPHLPKPTSSIRAKPSAARWTTIRTPRTLPR